MIDATIDVWLCKGCERFNRFDAEKCENRYCKQPKPDAVTIHQIGLNSPAAMELLGNTGKGAKNAAKGSKTGKKKAEKKERKPSSLEWQFEALWRETGLPMPMPEFRFHPVRRWRFDYCFVNEKIAIELEGGVYSRGRHTRGKGYEADCDKYNQATLLGFRVLRFTKVNAETISTVETLFRQDETKGKAA
jgi:very-short-patch-repair endonuclease